MKTWFWVWVFVAGLSGCATSLEGERYRAIEPRFDLFQFFDGNVKAWGLVQNRKGEVIQKFEVDIEGTISGNRITLDERFEYSIGTGPARRVWQIERLEVASRHHSLGNPLGNPLFPLRIHKIRV